MKVCQVTVQPKPAAMIEGAGEPAGQVSGIMGSPSNPMSGSASMLFYLLINDDGSRETGKMLTGITYILLKALLLGL